MPFKVSVLVLALSFLSGVSWAKSPVRARDLGLKFSGTQGALNAITDVPGVGVSQIAIIEGAAGSPHAARTGVTAIFPKAHHPNSHVPGAWGTLNGNGEMTGTTWLDESGDLEGPVLLTNTYSVGLVRDAVREWANIKYPTQPDQLEDTISLPIVAETYDGFLNDINGFHVKREHVFKVLDSPSTGPVSEGNIGGGTGMICFKFKCGIGTASRRVDIFGRTYTVGILVQANFGRREDLLIEGVGVGKDIPDLMPINGEKKKKDGSIIVVLATDAPLLPHQLKRMIRRIPLGIARTGGIGDNSSGDIFIAFSTVEPLRSKASKPIEAWASLPNGSLDELFRGVVEATEEAILNALVAGKTMEGVNGNKVYAIPHDRLIRTIAKYRR